MFCCKDDLHTLFFVAKTINAPFFVTKRIYARFFIAKTIYAFFFVAKMIYALRPESFCALEVAIRKVQTFWASGAELVKIDPFVLGVRALIDMGMAVTTAIKTQNQCGPF